MINLINKNNLRELYARFPESLFSVDDHETYVNSLIKGLSITSDKDVVIAGLCKDIADTLTQVMARLYKTASLFGSYKIAICENDSTDGTSDMLKEYASADKNIILTQEDIGHTGFSSKDKSLERASWLSYLRNLQFNDIKKIEDNIDYIIFIDLDLDGGWSYDGILNTFAYPLSEWDAMTANGIYFRSVTLTTKDRQGSVLNVEKDNEQLFYDTWAYRKFGVEELDNSDKANLLSFERGEKPFEVFSNFNGLGVYKYGAVKDFEFGAEEHEDGSVSCDWPYLHRRMRKFGKKIFLNPSLITLYSPHEFS